MDAAWDSAVAALKRVLWLLTLRTSASNMPLPPHFQVDAAWDAAVAALKRVLEPAFSGAAAAAQMLTVKDFLLLSCLALGGWLLLLSCLTPAVTSAAGLLGARRVAYC